MTNEFITNINAGESTNLKLSLQFIDKDAPFEVKIGDLPNSVEGGFLKKTNIIKEVDWSFIFDSDTSIDYDLSPPLKDEIDAILKSGKVKSKYEIDHVFKFGDLGDYICEDTFRNSFVNITTETNFITEDIHITEKSFKPLFFYQIPIFLSSAFHVKNLKEIYGFDLFEDVVNHDYDNETNFKKRFSLVCDEINRICLLYTSDAADE